MALYKIQGKSEKQKGIYYEFDSDDSPLGEGGMGKVYKGRCVDEHSRQSRSVAIKFMYSDLPSYAIEKARREAEIRFRHENLVEMLGFIETEDKGAFGEIVRHYHVVSELLEGIALSELLDGKFIGNLGRYIPYAEKLFREYHSDPCRFAVNIVKCILSGLNTMHDAGYIHRDIDPSNIMVTIDGHIKLIDFGIAKKFNALTSSDKHLTSAGQFVGKPEFAAPELVLGAIDEQNQTTDIYAVGILLFQLIVGHPPFEGDRTEVLQKQLHESLPLRQVKNSGLRKIISKATEKSRAKRYQSASEFRVDLDRLNSATTSPSVEWKPRYTYMIGGAAACCAIVVAATLFITKIDPQTQPQELVTTGINSQIEQAMAYDYASATALLHDRQTSDMGLRQLDSLSAKGDARASFLLSRLYFNKKKADDYFPDSIVQLQNICGIQTDCYKSHELLKRAVEQDPSFYQAVYELASDYLGGPQRTDAVKYVDDFPDFHKCHKLFVRALTDAQNANDQVYVDRIKLQMYKYVNIRFNGYKKGVINYEF